MSPFTKLDDPTPKILKEHTPNGVKQHQLFLPVMSTGPQKRDLTPNPGQRRENGKPGAASQANIHSVFSPAVTGTSTPF